MKKLIGVSLIAILTVGAAHAAPEYADAVPVEPISITANAKVASTSYVQGAYNEAIKAVNKENQRALAAEGDLTTLTTTTTSSLVGAINSLKTEITNIDTGVQSVTEGTTNGTIKVDDTDVAVHGLGSAAFTEASAYATAAQGALADTAIQSVTTGDATSGAGTIKVDGNAVSVYGLGSAAYVNTNALADTAGTYDNTTSGLTATTIQDAIDEVAGTAGNALTASDITTGATNGTIAVDGTDVTVHGLGSAAFADTTDFDAAGDAAAAEAAAKTYADAKFLDVYTTWNADTHQPVNLSNPTNP